MENQFGAHLIDPILQLLQSVSLSHKVDKRDLATFIAGNSTRLLRGHFVCSYTYIQKALALPHKKSSGRLLIRLCRLGVLRVETPGDRYNSFVYAAGPELIGILASENHKHKLKVSGE